MKKTLKYLSILFILLFTSNVRAEEKTVFSLSNIKASSGGEVTITVNIKNNPKFELLGFKVYYDSSKLEYISCGINGFSNAMLKDCNINKDKDITFYALTMYTEDNKLMDDTGDIVDIKFKIKDNVKNDIPLSLDITDFGKTDTEPLDFDIINGKIEISGDIESKVVNEKDNLSDNITEKKDITWESSDKSVATVDSNGEVKFKDNGNVTITATDSDGNIVYEKTYLVNNKIKVNYTKYILIGVGVGVLIIIVVVILIIIKRKKKKNEKNN